MSHQPLPKSMEDFLASRGVDLVVLDAARRKRRVSGPYEWTLMEWEAYAQYSELRNELREEHIKLPAIRAEYLAYYREAGPSIRIVTDADFDTALRGAEGAVIVQFFVSWRPSCLKQAGALEQVAKAGHQVLGVDCDVSPDIAQRYSISQYPQLLLFQSCELQGTYDGSYRSVEGILAWIQCGGTPAPIGPATAAENEAYLRRKELERMQWKPTVRPGSPALYREAAPSISILTDADFDAAIRGADGFLVVQFFNSWNLDSFRQARALEQVVKAGHPVFALDCGASYGTAQRYIAERLPLLMRNGPLLLLFRNGELQRTYSYEGGGRSAEGILAWIERGGVTLPAQSAEI